MTEPTTVWPAALAARPLLVYEPHALEVRDAFLRTEAEFSGPAAAAPAGDKPRYSVIDGVAVIPISGVLISRGDFMGGGAYTSYGAVTREVNRAVADPAVRAIVTAISSPGGLVDGILAAAGALRAARDVKPVTAHIGSMALSAGYWLAAQANEIVLDNDLSLVGSIGVYTMHLDISRLLGEAGIDVTLIASGRHKVDGTPFQPLPSAVRDRIQLEIDDLRLMFARDVALGRGDRLTSDLALATEARVYRAFNPRNNEREAIANRLADRVGTLGSVIGELARRTATPPPAPPAAAALAAKASNYGWSKHIARVNARLTGGAPVPPPPATLTAASPPVPPAAGRAANHGWAKVIAAANARLGDM